VSESESIMIVERLKEATRRNVEEEERGVTGTPNLDRNVSYTLRPWLTMAKVQI
jgi:hypothetical protein